MQAEFEALAREAATANENYQQYLLRLTELEVTARAANVLKARIKQANFPVIKDLDSYDFTAQPSLPKLKVPELAGGEWIQQRFNICCVGNSGAIHCFARYRTIADGRFTEASIADRRLHRVPPEVGNILLRQLHLRLRCSRFCGHSDCLN